MRTALDFGQLSNISFSIMDRSVAEEIGGGREWLKSPSENLGAGGWSQL